ncbi:PepSY-associated TM helix domain-containing protein [Neisseria animalis]|uniref:PepSY domain-containing protein n=1 Tax=Neisseria animalis TaxID=492 RepID=A0A5P3MQZ1_NEIAN|nr:PepSY domain-containing protein [Neisseria animalis]QEY23475.1 PepSY domain-containing protein [Neisseria animalis]ROW33322.1 PepSY domain-containing protein [Neisseria animalis]VEE09025.1 membrane protein [Neisseria animalis]
MVDTQQNTLSRDAAAAANRRYLTVWRWHFYAGIFVAPFLMLLAATGLAMLLLANISGREGERLEITPQAAVQPLSVQAESARASLHSETASVVQYIAPRADNMVAVFRVNDGGKAVMAAVDPYTAQVVKTYPRNQDWYHLMDEIHSDMLIGTFGDYLLETAASLTILLIVSGLYLWWAKQGDLSAAKKLRNMLFPVWGSGRNAWRCVHSMLGTWLSLVLLTFCLSGIAWAGIWGGKMVQAWSQFPAGKWGVAPNPESDAATHGKLLNDGKTKEVPWVLELTPMPQSGTTLGENGIAPGEPITLETVDRYAREIGFRGRYQLNLPQGETGVWTLSQDSMSYDANSPTIDRTVHIDQYSGKLLADIRYDDYNWFGKFMAVSIALHMGTLGWWSVAANVLFCLAVIAMCASGFVMWWKRRPAHAVGLTPPAQKTKLPPFWAMAAPLLLIATVFPTAVAAILLVWVLDTLVLARVPALAKWFK